MVRVAEPTRVCVDCKQRKPWSMFYAKKRWPDGTMRQPHSYCKACRRIRARRYDRERRSDPRVVRQMNARWWAAIKADPERYATRLEQMRSFNEQERRARGVSPRRLRSACRVRGGAVVPVAPFAAWVQMVLERDSTTVVDLAARFGVHERRLRDILKGRTVDVELATVERALIADGTTILDEIYPLEDAA